MKSTAIKWTANLLTFYTVHILKTKIHFKISMSIVQRRKQFGTNNTIYLLKMMKFEKQNGKMSLNVKYIKYYFYILNHIHMNSSFYTLTNNTMYIQCVFELIYFLSFRYT